MKREARRRHPPYAKEIAATQRVPSSQPLAESHWCLVGKPDDAIGGRYCTVLDRRCSKKCETFDVQVVRIELVVEYILAVFVAEHLTKKNRVYLA